MVLGLGRRRRYGDGTSGPDAGYGAGRGRRPRGPLGLLVYGISTGIHLASESYHQHQEKKEAAKDKEKQEHGVLPSYEEGHDELDHSALRRVDEVTWDLDEAQRDIAGTPPAAATENNIRRLADAFATTHPISSAIARQSHGLPFPVILAQCRPDSHTLGFVRAYAPILAEVGIEQSTFLSFIDELNSIVRSHPQAQVLNIAALAGKAVPEPFIFIASFGTKLATSGTSNIQSSGKINEYLYLMNEGFFKPRGLVSLVVTWKPELGSEAMTSISFGAHNRPPPGVVGGFEWPETAPLTFPQLDELAEDKNGHQKKTAIKNQGQWVQQYLEVRAQTGPGGESLESSGTIALPKLLQQVSKENSVVSIACG